jgi:hypothetical protein
MKAGRPSGTANSAPSIAGRSERRKRTTPHSTKCASIKKPPSRTRTSVVSKALEMLRLPVNRTSDPLSSNDQVERPRRGAIYEAVYRSRPLQPIVRRMTPLHCQIIHQRQAAALPHQSTRNGISLARNRVPPKGIGPLRAPRAGQFRPIRRLHQNPFRRSNRLARPQRRRLVWRGGRCRGQNNDGALLQQFPRRNFQCEGGSRPPARRQQLARGRIGNASRPCV